MRRILFSLVLAGFAAACPALELTLTENRGEFGSVGYVDVEQVFSKYPETVRAKTELDTEINKREEQLKARRQELYAMRAELEKLRKDFATLKRENSVMKNEAAAQQAKTAAALAATEVRAQADIKQTEDTLKDVLREDKAEISTVAVSLPVSTAPASEAVVPSVSLSTAVSAVAVSTGPSAAELAVLPGFEKPEQSAPPPQQELIVRSSAEIAAMEEKIVSLEKRVLEKEKTVEEYRQRAEKELLEYENRRMEVILGRIYFVLKDVAVAEGVSVVIDKKSILYGQNAVDLTGKLLKKLEEQ
ncbi:MAG: OmpH family outer membrane protein [Elusimicrobiaceae bacterium]